MESSNEADLRSRLRSATASLHRRTEAVVAEHAPLTDRAGYARFLSAMREVYCTVAGKLARGADLVGCDSMVDRAIAAIDADLTSLGEDVALGLTESAQPAIGASRDDVPTDDASALGVLYVVEGSAHGAAVLHTQLGAHYGEGAALTYLGLLREHGPARWRRVLAALSAPHPDGVPDRVVAAAQAAFAQILAAILRQVAKHE